LIKIQILFYLIQRLQFVLYYFQKTVCDAPWICVRHLKGCRHSTLQNPAPSKPDRLN